MFGQGIAKAQFNQLHQNIPWEPFVRRDQKCDWAVLSHFLNEKRVTYLDYLLVERFRQTTSSLSESSALFFCHLMQASKKGHLCVRIDKDDCFPSVVELWQNEEDRPLNEDEIALLKKMIMTGLSEMPAALMTTLKSDQDDLTPLTPLCRYGNLIYLQRSWLFESLFLRHLNKHLMNKPTLEVNEERIRQSLDLLVSENKLLPSQAKAIIEGCIHSLTLVTGGPGTGKTYTAGYLIKVFWDNLPEVQQNQCEIICAAPTGKAAANLQRSLSKAFSSNHFPSIQAKTLHALLGAKKGAAMQEKVRLSADLLIVDESSMIDARMMASLFESLKPGSRLILLGDCHQLPSIEAGNFFMDLIQLQQHPSSLKISYHSLTQCMRAERQTLIEFAEKINDGAHRKVLSHIDKADKKEICRLQFPVAEAQRKLIEHALPCFPLLMKAGQTSQEIFDQFQGARLLSPLRKGPFGVESLNQAIYERLIRGLPQSGFVAIPIMVAANDYRQELFNGATGVLIRRLPLSSSVGVEDYALFPSLQEEGRMRQLPALLLPKYEKAYCLSVHKSQGSEFNRVILILPENAEHFGRELFYTAVTRARQSIEIYGTDETIAKILSQKEIRLSGIYSRVKAKSSEDLLLNPLRET